MVSIGYLSRKAPKIKIKTVPCPYIWMAMCQKSPYPASFFLSCRKKKEEKRARNFPIVTRLFVSLYILFILW